jgi:16S rRNA processing protein RimM
MNQNNLILIATSSSTHGLKGEFSVKLINDESTVLKVGLVIYIKSKTSELKIGKKIESIRYGNKVILKLEGINSKTESDLLLPFEVYVTKDSLPGLEEDEYYIMDLIGSKVFNSVDGEYVGELIDYYENSVQTIVQIKSNFKIIDVIFNEIFVKEVDIENKIIKIIVPEEID